MGVSRCTVWRGDGVDFEWSFEVVSFGCLVEIFCVQVVLKKAK